MTNVIILLIIPSNCKLMLFAWKNYQIQRFSLQLKNEWLKFGGWWLHFSLRREPVVLNTFPSPLEILPENAFWSYLSGFLVTVTEKQNFEIFGLKVTQQSWFFAFCFSFLFFSCWALIVGFTLVGKVFLRAFRILGLDERQGRWLASGTRFSWKFSGQCYMFFVAFFHPAMVWEISSLCTGITGQSCPWPLKLMMPQEVERTWICMCGLEVNGLKVIHVEDFCRYYIFLCWDFF